VVVVVVVVVSASVSVVVTVAVAETSVLGPMISLQAEDIFERGNGR
jgi:hypothetical protein